jgi:DNA-binding beta-propeller fold protein YncE
VLAWALARISCRRGPRGATLNGQMRWGWLAATVALGLGCSLRNLDDLTAGSAPPADATTPGLDSADAGSADVAGASGRTLFFVDSGDRAVHSANIDGSGARRLLTLPMPSYLRSITVDAVHQKIYFSDSGLKKIARANFDGSALEDIVTGLDTPVGLDLDVPGGKLYFADQGTKPTIFRASLDGTGKEPLVTTSIMHPYGLAIDHTAGRLYFVDNGVGAIFRAGLDGAGLEKLAVTGLVDPIEIAVDPPGGKIYWTELGMAPMPPRIRRANLDGTGTEDVVTQARQPTLSTPLGVAVDVLSRKLYWVDGGSGTLDVIQRAELDGSGVRPVVVGLSAPRGLSIGY